MDINKAFRSGFSIICGLFIIYTITTYKRPPSINTQKHDTSFMMYSKFPPEYWRKQSEEKGRARIKKIEELYSKEPKYTERSEP